jgi:hypothetical protein
MSLFTLLAQADPDVFGNVTPPPGVAAYDAQAGGIGLVLFASNLIRLGTIIAGIWVFFNFITAGYEYITAAGDTGSHKKVQEKLTMSVMGLVIIVMAYTVAGVLGLIIFGDASYILNPKICGPGEVC